MHGECPFNVCYRAVCTGSVLLTSVTGPCSLVSKPRLRQDYKLNGVASWFEKAEIKQIAAMNNNLHKKKNNKMIVKPLTTLRYVRKQQGVTKRLMMQCVALQHFSQLNCWNSHTHPLS